MNESHLSDWQLRMALPDLEQLRWTALPDAQIAQLVQALIRDQLQGDAPASRASEHVADLLLGLSDPASRQFQFRLPVLAEGDLHQIEFHARLQEEQGAVGELPMVNPEMIIEADSEEEAEALRAMVETPAIALEDAESLLERLTPGSVAQAVRAAAKQFAHEPPLAQAQMVAAGLTAWAFARTFRSMDCEMTLTGLEALANPGQAFRLDMAAREHAMPSSEAPPRRRYH